MIAYKLPTYHNLHKQPVPAGWFESNVIAGYYRSTISFKLICAYCLNSIHIPDWDKDQDLVDKLNSLHPEHPTYLL